MSESRPDDFLVSGRVLLSASDFKEGKEEIGEEKSREFISILSRAAEGPFSELDSIMAEVIYLMHGKDKQLFREMGIYRTFMVLSSCWKNGRNFADKLASIAKDWEDVQFRFLQQYSKGVSKHLGLKENKLVSSADQNKNQNENPDELLKSAIDMIKKAVQEVEGDPDADVVAIQLTKDQMTVLQAVDDAIIELRDCDKSNEKEFHEKAQSLSAALLSLSLVFSKEIMENNVPQSLKPLIAYQLASARKVFLDSLEGDVLPPIAEEMIYRCAKLFDAVEELEEAKKSNDVGGLKITHKKLSKVKISGKEDLEKLQEELDKMKKEGKVSITEISESVIDAKKNKKEGQEKPEEPKKSEKSNSEHLMGDENLPNWMRPSKN